MATEVELKLALPAAHAAKVAKLRWLRGLRDGAERHEHLGSVYFDTPKLKLRNHGIALRVRRSGERRLQTIKATGIGANGGLARGEWEQEIHGNRPVLELARGTPLERLVTKKLRRKLTPIFETLVDRTVVPLRSDGAELELALDHGQIKHFAGQKSEPISEIELEVKRGDRFELSSVAKRLARSVAVTYDPVSKAERGYALSRDESRSPVRARPIVLDERMSMADAFTVIGLSCLDHALSNERAVRAADPEGVHQMRVGLRRLRAALSMFKELAQGPELQAVKRELKWLTEQLAPARAIDVLLEERVNRLRDHTPVAAEARILSRALDEERAAGFARARAALQSRRYRALGLTTALWLAEGSWTRSRRTRIAACRRQPVKAFAAKMFRRRSKKLVKKARRIEELNATQRHKLRIASKKLRYATEFFASLFSGKKRTTRRRRLRQLLKTFQGALGTLNDIEVHKGFAARIARPRHTSSTRSREALAMGYIAGQEQKQVASCMAVVEDATGRLDGLPGFWK